MTDELQPCPSEAPIDGGPTWLRALQAALVGLIAGLALHAILSIVVLQARDAVPAHAGPKECKRSAPARETVAPKVNGPAISSIGVGVSTPSL